jgi:hypothetical protein
MNQLLIFGDSWAAGSELSVGQQTFGKLLAGKLNRQYLNFAIASSAIPNLVTQIKHAVSAADTGRMAIFFLSSPDRDFIYDQQGNHQQIYASDDTEINRWWYRHVYSEHLAEFRINTVLLALRQICEIHDIDDRYIWGWEKVDLWPEIDHSRFFERGAKTCLDLFDDVRHHGINDYANNPQNLYVSPNICHPNQLGHEKIADALYEWIEKCPKMSKPS